MAEIFSNIITTAVLTNFINQQITNDTLEVIGETSAIHNSYYVGPFTSTLLCQLISNKV